MVSGGEWRVAVESGGGDSGEFWLGGGGGVD